MKAYQYLPEGYAPLSTVPLPLSAVQRYMEEGEIVEGTAVRCDGQHNIHIKFHGYDGVIPREEAVWPEISGAGKDIALLSLVGRSVQFLITNIQIDGGGKPTLHLSRRQAQQRALAHILDECPVGTVCRGKITHLERFGAFVDIGGGVIALLPLEHISMARISHPNLRFTAGQRILAVMKQVDREKKRFTLSHKELLGTWLENAALFAPGETVTGYVRGIKDYGIFIELTPNLSGLADFRPDLQENDAVSVFVKSIRPEQMKIRMQILQKIPAPPVPEPPRYYITDGRLAAWRYAPVDCEKDTGSVTFFP